MLAQVLGSQVTPGFLNDVMSYNSLITLVLIVLVLFKICFQIAFDSKLPIAECISKVFPRLPVDIKEREQLR